MHPFLTSDGIHSYASRLLGSQEAADDVTQDVFLGAWQSVPGPGRDVPIQVWLYRLATNRCIDLLRCRRLISWLSLSSWREPAGAADPVGEAAATSDAIRRTLAALPPRDAVLLVLHSAQGLAYREIAEILGMSPGATASALSRDGGKSWTTTLRTNSASIAVGPAGQGAGVALVGGFRTGLFRSADGGRTWTQVLGSASAILPGSDEIGGLAFLSSNEVVAAQGATQSWQPV